MADDRHPKLQSESRALASALNVLLFIHQRLDHQEHQASISLANSV